MRLIKLLGAELEGGWNRETYHNSGNYYWGHDASIRGIKARNVAELKVGPVGYEEMVDLLTNFWPDEVNSSCGFHIHFSLKSDMSYQKLMCKKFYEHFLKSFEKWGEKNVPEMDSFWRRYRGKNKYCEKNYAVGSRVSIPIDPYYQALSTGRSNYRYTQLNYCKRLHGTIECRMLPMFPTVDLGISALDNLIECVESFLFTAIEEEPAEAIITEDDLLVEEPAPPKSEVEVAGESVVESLREIMRQRLTQIGVPPEPSNPFITPNVFSNMLSPQYVMPSGSIVQLPDEEDDGSQIVPF